MTPVTSIRLRTQVRLIQRGLVSGRIAVEGETDRPVGHRPVNVYYGLLRLISIPGNSTFSFSPQLAV